MRIGSLRGRWVPTGQLVLENKAPAPPTTTQPMQHTRTTPYQTAAVIRAYFVHFFDSARAFWAPAQSPDCARPLTLLELMMAMMPSGQNRSRASTDMPMLFSGGPGCCW